MIFKGGHLDFYTSCWIQKYKYHWNLYEKTIQIINNKESWNKKKKTFFYGVSLKGYVAS